MLASKHMGRRTLAFRTVLRAAFCSCSHPPACPHCSHLTCLLTHTCSTPAALSTLLLLVASSRVLYRWVHIVCCLWEWTVFSCCNSVLCPGFLCISGPSLLWKTPRPADHSPVPGGLGCFQLGPLCIMLLQAFVHRFLCEHQSSLFCRQMPRYALVGLSAKCVVYKKLLHLFPE